MSVLLKDLNEEKICDLTVGQIYNIMFGPLVDLKKRIENEKANNNESLVAVYGGRTDAMERRVNGLNKLSQYVSLENGVILSGNSHWMGKDQFKDEITEERIKEKFPLLYSEYDRTKESFEEFIMRHNESDIMESKIQEFDNLKQVNLFTDTESTNSKENAVYTVEKFTEEAKKNPNLKRLVVISDWPYLLRQLLTTQKAMLDNNEDFEVTGYPSSTSDEIGIDYKDENNFLIGPDTKALISNLRSIVKYINTNDVFGDFDVEYYIQHKGLIEGGPSIFVGGEKLENDNPVYDKVVGQLIFGDEYDKKKSLTSKGEQKEGNVR